MCGGNIYPFLAKLVTYKRCVVAINSLFMTRNKPTIGVWWKYMSIFGKLSHLQYVCSDDKWSSYDEKWTYNRCVVEPHVYFLTNYPPVIGV